MDAFYWRQVGTKSKFPSEGDVCEQQKCLQNAAVPKFTFRKGQKLPRGRAREHPNQQPSTWTLLPDNCILWCLHTEIQLAWLPRVQQGAAGSRGWAGGGRGGLGWLLSSPGCCGDTANHPGASSPGHLPELKIPSCLIRSISGDKKLLPVMFTRAGQPSLHVLGISTSRQGKLISNLGFSWERQLDLSWLLWRGQFYVAVVTQTSDTEGRGPWHSPGLGRANSNPKNSRGSEFCLLVPTYTGHSHPLPPRAPAYQRRIIPHWWIVKFN